MSETLIEPRKWTNLYNSSCPSSIFPSRAILRNQYRVDVVTDNERRARPSSMTFIQVISLWRMGVFVWDKE